MCMYVMNGISVFSTIHTRLDTLMYIYKIFCSVRCVILFQNWYLGIFTESMLLILKKIGVHYQYYEKKYR